MLGQQGRTRGNFASAVRHEACRALILDRFCGFRDKRLIVFTRENRDFTTRCLLKANIHGIFLIVNFSSVADSNNNDRAIFFVKYHSPVAYSEP